MGFFQDLKQDLSQAVNELEPENKTQDNSFAGVDASLMGDLEAMLEKEVDSLQVEETSGVEAAEEIAPALVEEAVVTEEIQEPAKEPEIPMEVEVEVASQGAQDVENLLDEVDSIMGQPEKEATPEWPKEDIRSNLTMADVSSETAIVTEGMIITGDVSGNGSMEIIGTINGNIDIAGKLDITGVINGNSSAAEIYAESAQINGEVVSHGSIKVGQSTVIIGNIQANSAVIAGAVKGDIDVHGPVILDASAIVMGNIKSKSVQINNGAVIEGMCSQCYAEVSPSSFFNDVKKSKK